MAIYGYARVSTEGQTLEAQLQQLKAAGAEQVFREKISGAATNRAQLARLLRVLEAGDVVLVTRLDRLARSTRDLLNVLAAIADAGAAFRSLKDAWADTTTRAHPVPYVRGARAGRREGYPLRAQAEADGPPGARGAVTTGGRRATG